MSLLLPLLACDLPPNLKYPVMASFKYDGVCGMIQGNGDTVYPTSAFYARSLKEIPNRYVQTFAEPRFNGLHGELVVGVPNEEATFRRSSSGIMTRAGEPDFAFYVFDCLNMPNNSYLTRYDALEHWFATGDQPAWLKFIPARVINSRIELDAMMKEAIDGGYEGLAVRTMETKYKHGRSTKTQGGIFRWVPWERAEATVIGFEEGQHNTNDATINELGKTSRSTDADGMVPSGRLGAFLVRNISDNVEFKIGNGKGMDHAFCTYVWEHQDEFMGKIIAYKHKTVGGYDKPRQAQYVGWRDPKDL